jgi:hypothetical protein
MKIEKIQIAGITFININSLPKSEIRFIRKMPYNHSTFIGDSYFTKVYDDKFKGNSSRAGYAMVEMDKVKKYYEIEGFIDDHKPQTS